MALAVGRRPGRARLCGDDAAAARHASRASSSSTPIREGGGTNVVNVILVDFRGFDTLGEITVLAIVGDRRLFAAAPLPAGARKHRRRRRSSRRRADERDRPRDRPAWCRRVIMRLMFPAIGVFALYLLLRGHDLPGGGFVAGLTMAVAFILQYMAGGTRWVETRLRRASRCDGWASGCCSPPARVPAPGCSRIRSSPRTCCMSTLPLLGRPAPAERVPVRPRRVRARGRRDAS